MVVTGPLGRANLLKLQDEHGDMYVSAENKLDAYYTIFLEINKCGYYCFDTERTPPKCDCRHDHCDGTLPSDNPKQQRYESEIKEVRYQKQLYEKAMQGDKHSAYHLIDARRHYEYEYVTVDHAVIQNKQAS